jgi:phospholipase C
MEGTAGKSWKGYAESMPANCYPSDSGTYVPRHNPPPYYSNLTRCGTNDVPMGTATSGNLVDDVRAGTLPAYSHVTPNNCSNTHDCSILTGDNWLASIIPMIASGPDYQQGRLAIFLMWDEGFSTDHPPAFVLSAYTNPGLVSTDAFNPYSLLRTTEEIAGVPLLGNAASAPSMRAAFQLG